MTSCKQTLSFSKTVGILTAVCHSLNDREGREAQDILKCGPAVLQLMVQSANQLVQHARVSERAISDNSEDALHTVDFTLSTIAALAQEMINTIPFNIVPKYWLRLYTDVAILRSIGDLVMSCDGAEQSSHSLWMESIRRLDMAIIVAGALGDQRKKWILELINIIQEKVPTIGESKSSPKGERNTKRPRTEESSLDTTRILFAPRPIPVLPDPPTVDEYLQDHLDTPFIIRGYLKGTSSAPPWPACQRWSSLDYLVGVVGQGRVVPVEVGRAYDDDAWTQKIIPFIDFYIERASAMESTLHKFPELEKDMSFPDYVWSNPPISPDYPSYSAPQNADGLIVNVWVGSGDSEIISPAHTDPYYNCYAQVLGHKRVWLAPPASGPHMYAYGGKAEDGVQDKFDGHEEVEIGGEALAEQYMSNTSRVPILRPVDEFADLRSDYPRFFEEVWPQSMEAVLGPGDIMIMPPGWWHAMRGEGKGPAWSVSMWY